MTNQAAALTYTLNTGHTVTAKMYEGKPFPTTYANFTQATKAATKIAGADVIQSGRVFFVRVPA